eukprot:1964414-Pleurochrysis_carterae.AAC.2
MLQLPPSALDSDLVVFNLHQERAARHLAPAVALVQREAARVDAKLGRPPEWTDAAPLLGAHACLIWSLKFEARLAAL